MTTDYLSIRDLSIGVPSGPNGFQPIISALDLSIGKGEAYGLIGESGCGKSTVAFAVMRYLASNLVVPTGRIELDGEDILSLDRTALRRLRGSKVAMVYQDPRTSLNPTMKIGPQMVEAARLVQGLDRRAARSRALEMLRDVRLDPAESFLDRYAHELSGGQQQRIVIAMALMSRPDLLVMDEPTSALDVTVEAAILDTLNEIRARHGVTILFISHNLHTVAAFCDRVGVLYAGRLVEEGPVHEILVNPAHPYTQSLLRALPDTTPGTGRRPLQALDGEVSARDRSARGCSFANRCPIVDEALCCDRPIPAERYGGNPQHRIVCRKPGPLPDLRPVDPARADTRAEALPLLSVRGLVKTHAGGKNVVKALQGVDLEIPAGRTVAIVGESGSGKSTLARILAGLSAPDAGEITFLGDRIDDVPVDRRSVEQRRALQMIFQNPDSTLNPDHSVMFALTRPLRLLRGMSQDDARVEAERLARAVKLSPEVLSRRPSQLSGGQKQRVAIARAMAGLPRLLLADEPVSALDVSVQAAIINLMRDLQREFDIAYMFISHDLNLVRYLADWVVVLYKGQIVDSGETETVFANPTSEYTRTLIAAATAGPAQQRDHG